MPWSATSLVAGRDGAADRGGRACRLQANKRNVRRHRAPTARACAKSIETVHALMPHRVVLHVHCVDTIAFAVRGGCVNRCPPERPRLGLCTLCTTGPAAGARAIAESSGNRPDVLILTNHGLVIRRQDGEGSRRRCWMTSRRGCVWLRARTIGHEQAEANLLAGSGYRLPHSGGRRFRSRPNRRAPRWQRKGSLYPDHVIFLGAGSAHRQGG